MYVTARKARAYHAGPAVPDGGGIFRTRTARLCSHCGRRSRASSGRYARSDRKLPARYTATFLLLAATVEFVPRLRRPGGELPTSRLVAWLVLLFIFACLAAFTWKGG
jgi:hypothetical protein